MIKTQQTMLHATIIKLLLLLVTLILTFKKQFLKSQKHPKTFSLFLHISDWPGRYTWARRASRGRTWVAANNRTEPEARTRAPRRHAQRNRPPTVTKHLTYYTHKRRQSRWKNEPRVKREKYWLHYLQSTRVKMASRKRQTYQNEAKNLCTICVWLGRWMQI